MLAEINSSQDKDKIKFTPSLDPNKSGRTLNIVLGDGPSAVSKTKPTKVEPAKEMTTNQVRGGWG